MDQSSFSPSFFFPLCVPHSLQDFPAQGLTPSSESAKSKLLELSGNSPIQSNFDLGYLFKFHPLSLLIRLMHEGVFLFLKRNILFLKRALVDATEQKQK